MQTKKQCLEKVHEMAEKVPAKILEKADQLIKSGAIELEDYEDNYILPKILLVAALEYEADQWRPFDRNYQKTIKNLSHF